MTEPAMAPSLTANAPASTGDAFTITTRFGDLDVDPEKIINFDQGLYGLEHHCRFLLTSVPGWPNFFKLLQAIDDPSLSLIVLPLEGGDGPIDPKDFDQACATLGFGTETTSVIGIVTMRDETDHQVFTINLKAPLLIDTQRRRGRQHVFASDKYPLRHRLEAQARHED